MQLVGSVLVRNEDVYLERAIRNVAAVCDRIHVLDHMSEDETPAILRRLADELDHLDVQRSPNAADSHLQLQPYVGTDTWVLGVDGDELFDPAGLARMREDLESALFEDVFRWKAHVLNCDELDLEQGRASGFLAPPGRPVTKLYNFAAIVAWPSCPQRLLGVDPAFRPGFHAESVLWTSSTADWDDDPLRLLHVCFLRRSSLDGEDFAVGRRSLGDRELRDAGLRERLQRLLRRERPAPKHGNWKQDWYRRGERVTVDARPFFPTGVVA